jgi:hypothetical protein
MRTRNLLAIVAVVATSSACGPTEKPYEAKAAYSGKKPTLPQPPTLPNKNKKEGDAYTIWGAIHDIRSQVHRKDFEGKDTTLVGYIVKVNWAEACKDEMKREQGEHCVPKCAIHKAGKEDPAGCDAPIPTFWVADSKDEQDWAKNAIPVMGFASNFAQMYSFIEDLKTDDKATRLDPWSGVEMPAPLPNLGGKIKVKGKFDFTATVGSKGATSNPRTGVLTWRGQEWLEPPPTAAVLPGMDK